MSNPWTYYAPPGGLPGQDALMTGRATFRDAYAVIPRGVMSDIVTSRFPGWEGARAWVLARPLSGFAETFSQMIVELAPGGGARAPETDPQAQAVLFAVEGAVSVEVNGETHALTPGGFAYLPPGAPYSVRNRGTARAVYHWIRKRWEPAPGVSAPEVLIASDMQTAPIPMPDCDGRWATTRFVPPEDLRHDMHVNIVTLQPGGVIPFEETHVMEHGLYVLQGKGVYKLNDDWVEVEAGDFMWLRAFCPQACYAGGSGPFRYLLYKDVNRLPGLGA